MKQIALVENDIKSLQTPMESEMARAIKHFEGELIKIRTGRAHTSLIEDLPVSCYGQAPMSLKSIASIAAPDARLLTIQPWDSSVIGEIEKAVLNSDLGLNPVNDGKIIKLVLPEMSSSRREDLTKILHKKLEECRVAIRSTRKEFNNLIRDSKKDKTISENFFNRLEDTLQKVTDIFIKKSEGLADKKEHEIKSF